MKIYKLEVENFRLLKTFSMDLEEELSLVIGKNNTGKTSILSVLDKFLNEKSKFTYNDFNIEFRKELEELIVSPELADEFEPKGIKLKLFIEYGEDDNLSNVSRVIMDLDPDNNYIVLGFEYSLDYEDFQNLKSDYENFAAEELSKTKENEKYKPKEINEFLQQEIRTYFRVQKSLLSLML